jgi:Asp/Glu/hydantoin racemase
VLGLCESAVATAGFLAQRFTVVTTLERSRVLIDNLVRRYGMGGRARVRASDIPVLELEDPRRPARSARCAPRSSGRCAKMGRRRSCSAVPA